MRPLHCDCKARWEEIERAEEQSPEVRFEAQRLPDASPSMLSVLQEERAPSQSADHDLTWTQLVGLHNLVSIFHDLCCLST